MINFETATREELLAYIEQQKLNNKKVNKLDKLTEDIDNLFNEYSKNSKDKLLHLYFTLSVLFSNLEIPVLELLDKLDYVPEEEDIKKVSIKEIRELGKDEEFKLRKSKKNVATVEPVVEDKEVSTPL